MCGPHPGDQGKPCMFNPSFTLLGTLPQVSPQPHPQPHWCPKGTAPSLQELLCSFLRCLLRPAVVLGLTGPRGRVLALAQGKAGFTVGEEKGVEDKAGETRAQPCEPQQGPGLQGWGWRTMQSHRQRQASPLLFTKAPYCVTLDGSLSCSRTP